MHLKFTLQDYVSVGISLEHCTTISENSLVELEALKACYMVIIPINRIIMSNETCEIYKEPRFISLQGMINIMTTEGIYHS